MTLNAIVASRGASTEDSSHWSVEKQAKTRESIAGIPTSALSLYRKASTQFSALGNFTLLVDDPNSITDETIRAGKKLEDNAKKPIPAQFLLVTDDLHGASALARSLNMPIVIIGSTTSATENFGPPGHTYSNENIIAIQPKMSSSAASLKNAEDREHLSSTEYRITEYPGGKRTITVGAGIIPDHLNDFIKDNLGAEYYVPIDLTTSNQVPMGAVYATGGMGPIRVRPAEIIKSIKISDGETTRILTGKEVEAHQGLLGLTGAITEIELEIFEVPKKRFGLHIALPIQNSEEKDHWEDELAKLIATLSPATNLNFDDNTISSEWNDGYIDGIEIITRQELEFIIEHPTTDAAKKCAEHIISTMPDNMDFFAYVTGRSNEDLMEHFYAAEETPDPQNPIHTLFQQWTKGEIMLDPESNLHGMKEAREAIPYQSKKEANGKFNPGNTIWSASTDVNTTISEKTRELLGALNPGERIQKLTTLYGQMLRPYANYENKVSRLMASLPPSIRIKIRRYGHAHPKNKDPHTRVTVFATEEADPETFNIVVSAVKKFKSELVAELIKLRDEGEIDVTVGEKGVPPGLALTTSEKRIQIARIIAQADPSFSWRAQAGKLEPVLAAVA